MDQFSHQAIDETHVSGNEFIDEDEVTEIVESLKEAEYFDPSSMAPLTPTSVVSVR